MFRSVLGDWLWSVKVRDERSRLATGIMHALVATGALERPGKTGLKARLSPLTNGLLSNILINYKTRVLLS